MKATIASAGLATSDLLERGAVETRYRAALARLDEAERLRISAAGAPGASAPPLASAPPPASAPPSASSPPGSTTPPGSMPSPGTRGLELPASVLAETLGFLDDWRAIGRAAATCRAWALGVDDRVWRRALDNRWPNLGAVDPSVLGSNRERARDVCKALGGSWAAPRRLDARAVTEGTVDGLAGQNHFAAAFLLASTSPALPDPSSSAALSARPDDCKSALSYMGRLVRENAATLRSLVFWSRGIPPPRAGRMQSTSTAGCLRDILHDVELNTDNLYEASADRVADHISVRQLEYLLGSVGGAPSGGSYWTFFLDDSAGCGIYGPYAFGPDMDDMHFDDHDDAAKFFSGLDMHNEPSSDARFLLAFECDISNKLKSVFAGVILLLLPLRRPALGISTLHPAAGPRPALQCPNRELA